MWGFNVFLPRPRKLYGCTADLPYREDGDLLLGPSMIKRWSYAVSSCTASSSLSPTTRMQGPDGVPALLWRIQSPFEYQWSGAMSQSLSRILNDEEVIVHGDGAQTRSWAS